MLGLKQLLKSFAFRLLATPNYGFTPISPVERGVSLAAFRGSFPKNKPKLEKHAAGLQRRQ